MQRDNDAMKKTTGYLVALLLGSPVCAQIGQMPGWPVPLTAPPTAGSAVLGDLDGDGLYEIVCSTDSDRRIHALTSTGATMPGFPATLLGRPRYAPSVADLDADGDLEIVQPTSGIPGQQLHGRLNIVDHLGQPIPGYPKLQQGGNLTGSAALADLDDDGVLEVVATAALTQAGLVYVFDVDSLAPARNRFWPRLFAETVTGTPAVGDVDGDGSPEVAVGSLSQMHLLRSDGSLMPGWPQPTPGACILQAPALADLDDDGHLDIVVATDFPAGFIVYRQDGSVLSGWPKIFPAKSETAPPTVVDLDGDGQLEVLGTYAGNTSPNGELWVWSASGVTWPGFPYDVPGQTGPGPITVADIDGDGVGEIFTGCAGKEGEQGYVIGIDSAGRDLPGFPLRPIGATSYQAPAFADVDGDGDVELAVISNDAGARVNLYDLPGRWLPGQTPWPVFHQSSARGGLAGGGNQLSTQGEFLASKPPRVTVVAEPNSIVTVEFSLGLESTRTAFGWSHLGHPRLRTITALVVPSTGQVRRPFARIGSAALVGVPLYFQGLVRQGGSGRYTNLLGRTLR